MIRLSIFLLFALLFSVALAQPGIKKPGCTCHQSETRSGTGGTEAEACDDALSKCFFMKDCSKCKTVHTCGTAPGQTVSNEVSEGSWECTIKCTGGNSPCKGGSGSDDPHMSGFDSSKFDFHGVAGKHYVLFGRPGSDTLTATMRESRDKEEKNGVANTYFKAFGVMTGDGRKVLVDMEKDGETMRPVIKVDGELVSKNEKFGNTQVTFSDKQKLFFITTPEHQFRIKGARLDDDRAHFDVSVALEKSPSLTGDYTGVLGFTLNKALGFSVHESLDVSSRSACELEDELRKRYEADSLFSSRISGAIRIPTVVRMARRAVKIPKRLVGSGNNRE